MWLVREATNSTWNLRKHIEVADSIGGTGRGQSDNFFPMRNMIELEGHTRVKDGLENRAGLNT